MIWLESLAVVAGLLERPDADAPAKAQPSFDVKLFKEHPKDLSGAWKAYQSVRDDWKNWKFKRRFPQESAYRHSLAEETEALTAEIRSLEQLKSDIETAELVTEDYSLSLLLQLHKAGVLEPYVLFRLGDDDIARDYASYRNNHRDKLEEYMDKFVVPPTPVRLAPARQQRKPDTEQNSSTAKAGQSQNQR